ncbi:MAG: hypothetical protein HKL87_05570 [Acidimicrobiaceae bacterium]|nr:hypothetical protein [Acidimicrobiaceae bacterium]
MSKRYNPDVDVPEYKGRYAPYDILKEGTIALVVVLILVLGLAITFGSPDDKAITLQTWSKADPVDFATTAFNELNGTSAVAGYGPPYNTNGTSQHFGFISPAKWLGVHIPINTARDFVVTPLESQPASPTLSRALSQWTAATSATQTSWLSAYSNVSSKASFTGDQLVVPAAKDGPVPVMINTLTQMARSGALDQALETSKGFYTTDFTKPLLFLSDGTYFAGLAQKGHLLGTQWGMMNETDSYPGQAWLWLYTFWYQVSPFNTSTSADFLVWGLMMILTAVLVLVPFIPGVRSIPRRIKLYRLIWREHYRDL